jgi:hypothetical protein
LFCGNIGFMDGRRMSWQVDYVQGLEEYLVRCCFDLL